METFVDYNENVIRLTDERLRHISEQHHSLLEIPNGIAQTLLNPDEVRLSSRSADTQLYYRWYANTKYGNKYVCVVVVFSDYDAWIITAYLTDAIKQGGLVWQSAR